ncbi:MAG: carbohydrate ABC transporter permease [Bifidobacterium breve]
MKRLADHSMNGSENNNRGLRRRLFGARLSARYSPTVLCVRAGRIRIPLCFAVYMAFHDYFFTAPGVSTPKPFVGIRNFLTVLGDPDVLQSFRNIAVFLIINVPLTVILSMVLASALNAGIRWASAFRVAFYLPYITASVSLVGVWMLLFSTHGLVNAVLGKLAPDPSWLVNEHLAMPSIALYVTWKQLGFYILLYLAALECAEELQGAGRWRNGLPIPERDGARRAIHNHIGTGAGDHHRRDHYRTVSAHQRRRSGRRVHPCCHLPKGTAAAES